jgi:uncharacterized protein (TIGR03067 family)
MNSAILALGLILADGGESTASYNIVGADDRAELERGEWEIVGLKLRNGGEQTKEQLKQQCMRLTFKGETLLFSNGVGAKPQTYQFEIKPGTVPKQIDWTLPTIGDPKGIYQFDGDALIIAVPARRQARPTGFADPNIEMVLTLKRVKP